MTWVVKALLCGSTCLSTWAQARLDQVGLDWVGLGWVGLLGTCLGGWVAVASPLGNPNKPNHKPEADFINIA